MKIVLNKCYGGFSLSHEAKMRIFEKRGIKVFPYLNEWKDGDNFYEKYTPEKLKNSSLLTSVIYFKEKPPLTKFWDYEVEDTNYCPIFLNFDYEVRDDKDLVAVVEELGEKSFGRYAQLKVVEIPDGASYEISDYDGIETAHFGFNMGSV